MGKRHNILHPSTLGLNTKQKAQAKVAKLQTLRWLSQQFPLAFNTEESIRPLKIGIMEDILAHTDEAAAAGISKNKLRQAVVMFTRRLDYLACLKAQEMRIDLQGNPTEPVTAEEAALAAQKIKKRIEKTIKNSKKNTQTKPHAPSFATKGPFNANPSTKPSLPPHQYPEPLLYTQMNTSTPKPAPSITIKSARSYDPSAVARLKEKLGLVKEKESI